MTTREELLRQLTLEEKESLVNGNGMWTIPGVPRLGIPQLKVTDGPNGARGDGLIGTGLPALCIPCGSALGATWNPELIEEVGVALGVEARTKGSHVLLAPTINIHRSPLGGRNFECYSEDPVLSGKVAAAFVRGVQSQRVACTPKHFAGNDAEFERNTIDSVIDERALREIYLRPFEIAVKEGQAWGLMGAYNRLNGTFCCEHPWLLTDLLRGEWGFDGFVVTDWFALRSTAESAVAGLDLEMPGPGRMWGQGKLAEAVRAGDAPEKTLDTMVERMLLLMERTNAFEDPMDRPEEAIDRPEHRALARRTAAESMVLLKNDGVLPFDAGGLSRLAVIGPNADRAQIMGGGSANLRAFHYTTPLDALRERLGDSVEITYERGCITERSAPPLRGQVDVRFYDGHEPEGDAIASRSYAQSTVFRFGPLPEAAEPNTWSARAELSFTAEETGTHEFALVTSGWCRVAIDGEIVIDAWRPGVERGKEMFGLGSVELTADVALEEGRAVDIVVESSSRDAIVLTGFRLGCRPPVRDDLVARAVAAARDADAVVLVVGTNDDWETEGRDRKAMDLPGETDELVRQVVAANPRTAVVVNAGSPVTMPWAPDASAILDIWFGGQEMAPALADVLLGDTSPSGKLPLSFPEKLEHNPSFANFPGENSEVRYGESVFVGYRHYDATDRAPLFCFGHGLAYSTFELGAPRVSKERIAPGEPFRVEVDVTNTGDARAAEVVQCYVAQEEHRLARPPQELRAFAKVWLDPGESATITLALDERALAYWDPGDPGFEKLAAGLPVPAGGGGERRTEPGWAIDPGAYELHVGASSRDIRHTARIEVAEAR